MKKLKHIWIKITLFFQFIGFVIREAFRGAKKVNPIGNDVDQGAIEQSAERQVEELTSQEFFEYQTGVIGYYQQYAKQMFDNTGNKKWIKDIEDMDQFLMDMAAAHRDGRVKQWYHNETIGQEMQWDIWYHEDGTTLLIHKNENKLKHIDADGTETEYTKETAKAAGISIEKYKARNIA